MSNVIHLAVTGNVCKLNGHVVAEDLEAVQDAMEDIQYAIGNAATLFRLISNLTASGFALDEAELCALCQVSAEHFKKVADHEAEVLALFASRLSAAKLAAEEGGV